MKKHIQNLERLCQKMQVRYGEEDDLVLLLKQELTTLEVKRIRSHGAANLSRRKLDQGRSAPPLQ